MPEITPAGLCLTPCPHGLPVKAGSMACELCDYYFGSEGGRIRCAGHRIAEEACA